MGHKFAQTLFSPAVKALQSCYGSRATYDRIAQSGPSHDSLTPNEMDFIRERDSFYMATVSPDGWPYIQHRGGPKGFLKVLDARTLAFPDYSGNKQYISTGNLTGNDRVSLFLMDYPHRTRLKILGHASLVEPGSDPFLDHAIAGSGGDTRVERIYRIRLVAFDWNCPQYITPRYTFEEIAELAPASLAPYSSAPSSSIAKPKTGEALPLRPVSRS